MYNKFKGLTFIQHIYFFPMPRNVYIYDVLIAIWFVCVRDKIGALLGIQLYVICEWTERSSANFFLVSFHFVSFYRAIFMWRMHDIMAWQHIFSHNNKSPGNDKRHFADTKV